jgi:hypothetical protein
MTQGYVLDSAHTPSELVFSASGALPRRSSPVGAFCCPLVAGASRKAGIADETLPALVCALDPLRKIKAAAPERQPNTPPQILIIRIGEVGTCFTL